MDYTDYLLYKAIALVIIVFVVSFFYTLITGRLIEEDLSGKGKDSQNPPH